jgi:hypothetical protein
MTLLDEVATRLQTDPGRWPDKRGNYHADCPYCAKPAKKGQTHFCISADGLCYCQVCQKGTTLTALAEHLGVKPERNGQAPQTVYAYYDADGELAYEVVRYYKNGAKSFFQRHPDGNGAMVNGMAGVERVLYRLPELTQAVAQRHSGCISSKARKMSRCCACAAWWRPPMSAALASGQPVL